MTVSIDLISVIGFIQSMINKIISFQVSSLPDGLLAALDTLTYITISRNAFTAFPSGGPAQVRKCDSNVVYFDWMLNKLWLKQSQYFLNIKFLL